MSDSSHGLHWAADPFGAAIARPTLFLGLHWVVGGVLAVLWGAFGLVDQSPGVVVALGVFALTLGALLLVFRSSVLSQGQYVALVLLGSGAICAALWWSGPVIPGAPGIAFVYVGMFACIALGRTAWKVLALSAGMHAAILVVRGSPGWLGEWLVIWVATALASLMLGAAVAAPRRFTCERERLLAELRSADETKTAFLHALGHDLAAPAAVIVGLARTVIDRDAQLDPSTRRELLERIAANTIRLHDDLDGLLQLDGVHTGKLAVKREHVRLQTVIVGAIRRSEADERRIRCRGVDEVWIAADAAKLEHAVANLLSNAVKYGGHPGEPIVVGATEECDRTVIWVEDRGPGVPVEMRERIFEPLARARPEDVAHGSGIGLSVVRSFARFHDGESWVETAPDGGARFCIALPA